MKLSAEMQRFLRNLRRALRDVKDTARLNETINESAVDMVCAYESNGNHPKFLMGRMKRLITVTLRASETEVNSALFLNLKRFIALMKKSICLQQGRVCGKKSTTTCPICMQANGSSWWKSDRCGHCFHVQCIAKCFDNDQRCPLCRNDHWRGA
jgi:hypothetical protein